MIDSNVALYLLVQLARGMGKLKTVIWFDSCVDWFSRSRARKGTPQIVDDVQTGCMCM